MDTFKTITRLEEERTQIMDAYRLAQEQLTEAQRHVEKLKICIVQLQAKKEVYDKLLADKSFFDEKTIEEACEVRNAEA